MSDDETMEPSPIGGVALAIIDGGTWCSSFGLSLTELQLWDVAHDARIIRPGCGYLHHQAGTGAIAEARNEVTARFLADTSAEWLFMVDTDMGFAPNVLDQLLAVADPVKRPIVGALTFQQRHDRTIAADLHAKRWRIQPAMFRLARIAADVDAGVLGEEGFVSIRNYPRDQVIQVDGTGAACLLVHRSVFEMIADKFGPGTWFEPLRHPTGGPGGTSRWFSEDLSFCLRVSAVDTPISVHTGVRTSHHKGGIFLDETMYDRQRRVETGGLAVDRYAADTLYPESRWTSPRTGCPVPGLWHATDAQSTEVEVSELVAAFVRGLQPALVVETGSCIGQTSAAIGRALRANGHGRLISIEPVAQFVQVAQERCKGLPVEFLCTTSLEFLNNGFVKFSAGVGFAWLDSLTDLRIRELTALRDQGWLADRAIIGVHDTGPQHNPLGDQLRALPWIRYLDLPTPRGVVFLQVIDDD